MARRINAAGLSHVKTWEGCSLKAYRDVAGVWTIGYGSTGKHVKPGMVITQAQADELLKEDLARFERRVELAVKVPLTDNQFAALVSFAFNVGEGAFQGSTLLKRLNAGDYSAVPPELMKWVKATVNDKKVTVKGLVNRRKADGALFTTKSVSAPAKPKPEVGIPATKSSGSTLLQIIIDAILKLFGKAKP